MARSFNGTSDKINCGTGGGVGATSPFTAVAWVNVPTFNSLDITIVSKRDSFTVGGDQFFLGTGINGSARGWLTVTKNNIFTTSSLFQVGTGAWHHCAFTGDASNGWFYLDGSGSQSVLVGDTPLAATDWRSGSGTNQTLQIGALITEGLDFMNGSLADVALWNVALTAFEVLALSMGVRPGYIRPLALTDWWPLDGNKSPEPDLSGNANNGTLTGTTIAFGPPVSMFTRLRPVTAPFTVPAAPSGLPHHQPIINQFPGRLWVR